MADIYMQPLSGSHSTGPSLSAPLHCGGQPQRTQATSLDVELTLLWPRVPGEGRELDADPEGDYVAVSWWTSGGISS